ncbi:MAG TPA: glycosyltransferase family 2 protein [Candidatus Omnitrophota bacterium]|nr:glycosyltransferase family 2 protein [Candidatus Omnitrophota bacterium]
MKARIVILNYNGEEMLAKCLPSIAEAVRAAKTPTTVTILDNLSTDQSEAYVRKNFPEMDFVRASENLVLCSYNDYLKTISEPIAILLNNDIRVDPGFIDPLVKKFSEDPQMFLVAPRVHSFDGRSIEGVDSRFAIRFGMVWCSARYPGYEAHSMVPSRTSVSGFGAFAREKFLALGGYDRCYLPGILEDLDLCYRAAGAGYHLCYEPQSLVFHMGQASFKKAFSDLRRETLAYRNTFIFMWKNFHSPKFRLAHIFWLPFRVVWALLCGRMGFVLGLWEAIQRAFMIRHPEARGDGRSLAAGQAGISSQDSSLRSE